MQKEWELDAKELDEEYSSTEDELNAVAYGLTLWTEYQRYGSPREGGYVDQPMNWRLCMNVLHRAHDLAERDVRYAEAEEKSTNRR